MSANQFNGIHWMAANFFRLPMAAGIFVGSMSTSTGAERILAPLPESGVVVPNYFGQTIAASGNWLLIGAPGEDVPGVADAGVAYLYELIDGAFVQRTRLKAVDAATGDGFGMSVAIDGAVAIIGAPNDNTSAGSGAGSAYIFERNGAIWEQRVKLTQPDAATGDAFGTSVAVGADAIVVGSIDDDINGVGLNAGSAHLFQRVGGNWTYTQRLLASDPAPGARFGRKVAVASNMAVVSSQNIDGGAGAAYAFSFNSSSAQFQHRLTANDRSAGDLFGSAMAMDGSTILIGARSQSGAAGTNSGAAYVFTRSGGAWVQQAKLVTPDSQAGEQFGYSVALMNGFALVGAPFAQVGPICCQQGRAQLFLGSSTAWQYLRRLSIADVAPYDATGYAVSLNESGVFAGAPESNDPISGADATGSVIRYERQLSLFNDGFDRGQP